MRGVSDETKQGPGGPGDDALIGRNVARLRGDRAQQWLADEMRKRGWRWSQATVWSVEQGTRPLRLAEAQALASIMKVPLQRLFEQERVALAMVGVRLAADEVSDAFEAAVGALSDLLGAQEWLASRIDEAQEVVGSEQELDLEFYRTWFGKTPEAAREEVAARQARDRAADEAERAMPHSYLKYMDDVQEFWAWKKTRADGQPGEAS